jgi:predicted RNase H-like HicB family nuclease
MKKEFLVVFEIGKTSFGAFAPDIPGCFAVGPTLDETRSRYLEAVEAHLRWMAEDHDPIPQPVTTIFDFARETNEETTSYFVEWIAISLPIEMRLPISA